MEFSNFHSMAVVGSTLDPTSIRHCSELLDDAPAWGQRESPAMCRVWIMFLNNRRAFPDVKLGILSFTIITIILFLFFQLV